MTKIKLAIVDDCEHLRKAIIRLILLENDPEKTFLITICTKRTSYEKTYY